jgi:hypothetical protein
MWRVSQNLPLFAAKSLLLHSESYHLESYHLVRKRAASAL